ncbi:MAG TPA: hypothetical protein VF662_09230 [Allosphingosinicella sp.]|jgi:hypothetical protein
MHVVEAAQEIGIEAVMPRFFFHLHNDMDVLDEEGQDFPDLQTARAFAVANIRELLCEDVQRGRVPLQHWIDIEDEAGAVLAAVTFRETVTIEG